MTTNTAQNEFIQANDGVLTPAQAAQMLEMGLEGDTGKLPETGDEPDVSLVAVDDGIAESDAGKIETNNVVATDAELDPATTVIIAKDGKHTISYDKLVEAREGERQAKQLLQAAQLELDRLKGEAQQRVDAGQAPTVIDNQLAAAEDAIANGVDPNIFGDFSEEAIAKGIHALVNQQVAAHVAEVMKPLKVKEATDATEAHYLAIYEQHPDADSIVESKELADWIASQPSFARAGYETVLLQGSQQEVIELFDSFKQGTGFTPAAADTPAPAGDVKAAAKAVIANTPAPVPASLSDFPGGRPAAGTREEAMAEMSAPDLMDVMAGMSPQQIEQFLNRQL
jgi:hypothetical protein